MQIVLLILAGLVCPIAYGALISRMRTQRIEKPPIIPMFFLFGTIGGWMLVFALSPSGLAAMCIIFLMTAAPIALFVASVGLSSIKNKTIYHRVSMWGGFSYPAVLGLFLSVGFLLDRKLQAEQGGGGNSAALRASPQTFGNKWWTLETAAGASRKFISEINLYRRVETDRLHVGIVGAGVGKEVRL